MIFSTSENHALVSEGCRLMARPEFEQSVELYQTWTFETLDRLSHRTAAKTERSQVHLPALAIFKEEH